MFDTKYESWKMHFIFIFAIILVFKKKTIKIHPKAAQEPPKSRRDLPKAAQAAQSRPKAGPRWRSTLTVPNGPRSFRPIPVDKIASRAILRGKARPKTAKCRPRTAREPLRAAKMVPKWPKKVPR